MVGVFGIKVIAVDASDVYDVPVTLVAFPVNVYVLPLVNPDTMIGDVDPVAVMPSLEVIVYDVAPLAKLKSTVAELLCAVANKLVGGSGNNNT